MKHLLAFGAIAALGMGVSTAPAEAGTACYVQNGRRVCVQRGFNNRAYVVLATTHPGTTALATSMSIAGPVAVAPCVSMAPTAPMCAGAAEPTSSLS